MAEEDILYGKKRHFFGGIEPGNMKAFSAFIDGYTRLTDDGPLRSDSMYNTVRYILPDDTVMDGQTLCTVAGAIIRRKADGFPKDEFDGVLVADVKESGEFLDYCQGYGPLENWYYAAFPYTTQGVFNRNKINRSAVYRVAPDVDNIITDFTKTYTPLDGDCVNISVYHPYASKYMIRKSVDGYPESTTEGDLVAEITGSRITDYKDPYESFTMGDSGSLEYKTIYYTIFPMVDGQYQYKPSFCTTVELFAKHYLYGFDLDTTDPNPATRVTYPEDVDNFGHTPAKMDYENDMFDYGDWPSEPGFHFMPTPVMLKTDGTVGEYLNHKDYIRKTDGTDSSVSNINYDGNAMMQWPKIYTKRTLENGIYKFRCSNVKVDNSWECWCNYNSSNNEVDNFYTAIYDGCTQNGSKTKLRSMSGTGVASTIVPNNAVTYPTNIGAGWNLRTLADTLLIQDLLVMMAKTTDCQKAYGVGVQASNAPVSATGTMNDKGLFWGSEDKTVGVKVFGMEHWWGNYHHYVAGLIYTGNAYKIKLTAGTKDGSTGTGYNITGDGYKAAGYGFNASGYIRDNQIESFGRLPIKTGASATTYETDYAIMPSNSTSMMIGTFGGYSGSTTSYIGPFGLAFPLAGDTTQTTSTNYSATLSYKPES